MTYADDAALRREVYEAYTTRASELGPHAGQWDNGAIMDELLALRHEQAQLLGFANYAERSLATKMARSPEEVMGFLAGLAQRVVSQARQESKRYATLPGPWGATVLSSPGTWPTMPKSCASIAMPSPRRN
jgi:Zn-dependent oligopeptidase